MSNKRRRQGRPQPTDQQLEEINASMERQSYWYALRRLCLKAGLLATGKAATRFKRFADFLWRQLE